MCAILSSPWYRMLGGILILKNIIVRGERVEESTQEEESSDENTTERREKIKPKQNISEKLARLVEDRTTDNLSLPDEKEDRTSELIPEVYDSHFLELIFV